MTPKPERKAKRVKARLMYGTSYHDYFHNQIATTMLPKSEVSRNEERFYVLRADQYEQAVRQAREGIRSEVDCGEETSGSLKIANRAARAALRSIGIQPTRKGRKERAE